MGSRVSVASNRKAMQPSPGEVGDGQSSPHHSTGETPLIRARDLALPPPKMVQQTNGQGRDYQ